MPVKVECESCKATFNFDERRIPAAGLRVRCPKCGKTFVIKKPGAAADAPAKSDLPAARPDLPSPKPAADLPAAKQADLPAAKQAADLPAAKDADLPAARGAPPAARRPVGTVAFAGAPPVAAAAATDASGSGESLAKLPNRPPIIDAESAELPAARPVPAAPQPRPSAPRDSDWDLPAPADKKDDLPALPAVGERKDEPKRPAPKPFVKGTQLGLGAFVPKVAATTPNAPPVKPKEEIDLPIAKVTREAEKAPPADKPTKTGDPFGELDLPAVGKGVADLPAARANEPAKKPFAPPPTRKTDVLVGKGAPLDLPSPKKDADLPAAKKDLDLPAAKAAFPKKDLDLPSPKKAEAADLPSPKPGAVADLPAVAKAGDLPAQRRAPIDLKKTFDGSKKSPFAAPAGGAEKHDVGGDLPAQKPDFPAQKSMATAPARPPPRGRTVAGIGELDLPAVAAQLPAPMQAKRDIDLPAPKKPGEIDLPAVQPIGLPAVLPHGGGKVDLPAPTAAGLPAVLPHGGGKVDLPAPSPAGAHLPAVASPFGNLPAVTPVGQHLPTPKRTELGIVDAPVPPPPFGDFGGGAAGDLELDLAPPVHAPIDARAQDMGAGPDLGVAQTMQGPGYAAKEKPAMGGFGELELPGPEADASHALGADASHDAFGDLDLGPPPGDPLGRSPGAETFAGDVAAVGEAPDLAPSAADLARGEDRKGGTAFGELDLGGGAPAEADLDAPSPHDRVTSVGDDDMEFGAIPQQEGGAAEEAPLPPPRESPISAREKAEEAPKKKGVAGKVALGLFAVIVLAGASLEFTKHGAFGWKDIVDRLNAPKYAQLESGAETRVRQAFDDDTLPKAKGVLPTLDGDVSQAPRYQPLLAYAAYADFAYELRFGKDPAIDAAGNALLGRVQDPNVVQRKLAFATQQTVTAQYAVARPLLQEVLAADPNNVDAAVTLGELELRANQPKAAVAAFQTAVKLDPSARTQSGLMRALDAAGDFAGARKQATDIATKWKTHGPSRLLLARYAWEKDKDEATASKWLDELKKPDVLAGETIGEQVDALVVQGNLLFDRARISEARDAYEQALKKDARSAAALLGRAEVQLASGQYTDAASSFSAASDADPTLTAAKIGLARARLKLDQAQEARTILSSLKDPKYAAQIAYWQGQATEAISPDKPADASKFYDDAIKAQPSMVEPYIALATLLAKQGKYDEANAKLADAVKAVPPSAKLHLAIGELKYRQKIYGDAVTELDAALGLQADNLEALFYKARALLRMGKDRLDEGKKILDQIEEKDPKYPGLALEMGLYFQETNRLDEALKRYKSALDAAPKDVDVMLSVGRAMVESHDPNAVEMLKQALDGCPTASASPDLCLREAQHYLGRAYLDQGAVTAAIPYLKQAVEKDGKNAGYHLYYGWALLSQGNDGEAEKEIDQALDLDRSLGEASWLLAEIQVRHQQYKNAIALAQEALKDRPQLAAAHATIGNAYHALGDDETAMAEWKKAIDGDPRNPEAGRWHFFIADVFWHRNVPQRAVDDIKQAIAIGSKLDPKPWWLWRSYFFLGEALRYVDKNGAIDAYKTFLTGTVGQNDPARNDAKAALSDLGYLYNE